MTIWLSHKDSREFDRVDFDPTDHAGDGVYNLFRGLGVPREECIQNDEQAEVFTGHILDIWCSGDQKLCDFLLDWMAHLVQRPGVKMVCTPVLQGGQGAGKGIIVQMLGDILGHEHFIAATSLDAVTGTFQEDKAKTNLLTFLDECTFAGDLRQSSILKGLLSEAVRRWEAKYVNPIRIRNWSNYIVASNYEEIVYVEVDDRRWLCLRVNDKYAGPQTPESQAYFNTLAVVPIHHIAHLLYNRDISKFNPRAMPSTDYKRYQKRINFDTVHGWVELCLQDGQFDTTYLTTGAQDELVSPARWVEGVGVMSKKALYASYTHFAKQPGQKFKKVVTETSLFKSLYRLTGSVATKRGSKGIQVPCVEFAGLEKCRAAFAKMVHEPEWEWEVVGDKPQVSSPSSSCNSSSNSYWAY